MNSSRMIADSLAVFSAKQKAVLFILIFLAGAAGIIFPLLLSANPAFVLNISREYRAGELSDEDVIAPADFSYVDEVATNDVVKRAAESILPQFSYSVSSSIAMRTRFNDFSQAYASGNLSSFFEANDMYLDSDAIARLKSLSGDSATMILSLVSDCISELVSDGTQAVVSVEAATQLELDLACGQVHLVVDHEDLLRAYMVGTRQLGERAAGGVHVAHRLGKEDLALLAVLTGNRDGGNLGAGLGLPVAHATARGNGVDGCKAGVVTGAGVLGVGVAEATDDFDGGGLCGGLLGGHDTPLRVAGPP